MVRALASVVADVIRQGGLVAPGTITRESRLNAFPTRDLPLEEEVKLRWNPQLVPFIEAKSDHDAAFTLGLVHYFLRGAQIRVMKHIALGRLAEMAGPMAIGLDQTLRALSLDHAVPEMVRRMDPFARDWLQAFCDGMNHCQIHAPPPPEFDILGLEPEPWRIHDILAVSRLIGADYSWMLLFELLQARRRPEFDRLWERFQKHGGGLPPDGNPFLARNLMRFGSNSFAAAGRHTRSGSPILANDPHLGFLLPNFWLLAGVRSPSFEMTGMMVPGMPMMALGRNPQLAWGGTNMHACASDLYDVAQLAIESGLNHPREIKVRYWLPVVRDVCWTPLGPIISDGGIVPARLGEKLALRWVGHDVSDELGAFLKAGRSRNVDEFREAFADYAVSAMNMVAADSHGNITKIMAARLPKRSEVAEGDPVLNAVGGHHAWNGTISTLELPYERNPASGYVISANEKSVDLPFLYGLMFSPDDRVNRIKELLTNAGPLGFEEISAIQQDAVSAAAGKLAGELAELYQKHELSAQFAPLVDQLVAWRGDYSSHSTGPVVFESLLFHLVHALHAQEDELPANFYGQWNYLAGGLVKDLETLPENALRQLLSKAGLSAMDDSRNIPVWGEWHRRRVGHFLSKVPVLGRAFPSSDYADSGSRETVMKSAHGLVNARHEAAYGQQARQISDLADPDENYFLLFGGQDGWVGAPQFDDMIPLWRSGRYLRLPLRPASVAQAYPILVELKPKRI